MKTWRMIFAMVALLATGCSSAWQQPPAVTSSTEGTSGASVANMQPVTNPDQSAPEAILCGKDENRHGNGMDMKVRACFWDAYQAGKPAAFSTVAYTTEGDPIAYTVRVQAADRIDVSVDSKDKFGKQGPFQYTCKSMEQSPYDPGDTHAPNLQEPRYGFLEVGCSESKVAEVAIP